MENLLGQISWIFSGIGVPLVIWLFTRRKKYKQVEEKLINKNIKEEPLEISEGKQREDYRERIKEEGKNNPIEDLYERVIKLFNIHGIETSQIPEFINDEFNFNYYDLLNKEEFIKKITPNFLYWLSEKFGVNKQWIDGVSTYIYDTEDVYKYPYIVRNIILDEIKKNGWYFDFKSNIDAYAFVNSLDLRADNTKDDVYCLFVIRFKIGKVNNKSIYKSVIIRSNLRWEYWKCRRDIKYIIAIFEALGIYTNGYTLPKNILDEIGSGKRFPAEVFDDYKYRTIEWYPEDYIDGYPSVNKEEKEDILRFNDGIKEHIEKTRIKFTEDKDEYTKKILNA